MAKKTHTKILATLGPSSSTKEQIEKLIDAGVNAFRFNFSHGTHEEHKERYNIVRKLEKEKGTHIAVLADMQGPKLRVGKFKNDSAYIKNGDFFTFDMKDELGDETRVKLPHPEIFHALKVGDELLVDDGKIVLVVDECSDLYARTIVKVGGKISGHKGVNLPDTQLNISAITPKDEADLSFALKLGVDWVGLSFVQSADDVKRAKDIIGDKAWVVSKIEKPSAIDDLEEIVRLSDGIMIARGDLGVECPIQKVPVLQKRIVSCCRKNAKPVIVATQMLESMITSPSPTRAEVSDVANAVYEGADAVMLSAETAAGQYPIEAVKMMKKTICEVEKDRLYNEIMLRTRPKAECYRESDAIMFAATEVSNALCNVSAIITYTSSGKTTLVAAKERPIQPIIAITPDIVVARRMSLIWGVESFINKDPFKSFDKVQSTAIEISLENGIAKPGDYVILTAGIPFNKAGATNMVQTLQIPNEEK